MEMETFSNGRLGLRAVVWLHRSESVSTGLGCCSLGNTPALSVTTALLKTAHTQMQCWTLRDCVW